MTDDIWGSGWHILTKGTEYKAYHFLKIPEYKHQKYDLILVEGNMETSDEKITRAELGFWKVYQYVGGWQQHGFQRLYDDSQKEKDFGALIPLWEM